jgi:hypothetical protein
VKGFRTEILEEKLNVRKIIQYSLFIACNVSGVPSICKNMWYSSSFSMVF